MSCLNHILFYYILPFHRKRRHCSVHCGQGPTEWLADRQLGWTCVAAAEVKWTCTAVGQVVHKQDLGGCHNLWVPPQSLVSAPKADRATQVNTAKGQVQQATIQLGDSRSKLFMWGPLLGLVSLQRPAALWVECTGLHGCAAEVIELIKEEVAMPVVAIGDPVDVNGLMLTLNDCPERVRQSNSLIGLYVDAEPVFDPSPPHHKSKSLSVHLLSPHKKLQSHRNHLLVYNLPWRGSILDYCLFALGMVPKDFDQTVLYVPHPKRSPEDVLERAAYIMSVPPG